MATPAVDTLYGLHNSQGILVSYGPDEKQLWTTEIQKSSPEFIFNKDNLHEFVATASELMKAGWTMYEYKRVR